MNSRHIFLGLLIASATGLAACGNGGNDNMNGGNGNNPPNPPAMTNFVQVERLARPAINEGLILSNDFLNAFNSIPPSADLSDAAAPVRMEAVATLVAVGNADPAATAAAFLPDVMRIDTTVASPVGTSAFANSLNAVGSPVAGRKLEDDVIDVVLTVVTSGGITTDNVSYAGEPGNIAQGHQLLNGQSSFGTEATFPFLAPAN
ncbi:MAG TPA: DUF4331 family protein [bacterium]|nr:DUF4331 family protein [bacterium]